MNEIKEDELKKMLEIVKKNRDKNLKKRSVKSDKQLLKEQLIECRESDIKNATISAEYSLEYSCFYGKDKLKSTSVINDNN